MTPVSASRTSASLPGPVDSCRSRASSEKMSKTVSRAKSLGCMPWLLAHKGGIEDTLGALSRSMETSARTGGSTRRFSDRACRCGRVGHDSVARVCAALLRAGDADCRDRQSRRGRAEQLYNQAPIHNGCNVDTHLLASALGDEIALRQDLARAPTWEPTGPNTPNHTPRHLFSPRRARAGVRR